MPDLPPAEPGDERIEVLTGRAQVDLTSGALFDKDILIRRGEAIVTAPTAGTTRPPAASRCRMGSPTRDPGAVLTGRQAHFDALAERLRIDETQFRIFSVPARGEARVVEVEKIRQLEFRDVTYTTCATGNEDWLLRADSIEIDRDTGIAKARDARLEFKGVPFLYTPWIAYPVTNERTTGFLLPAIGRSESRGARNSRFPITSTSRPTTTPRSRRATCRSGAWS